MRKEKRRTIRSYRDLIVYQKLYKAMLMILNDVVPKLPIEEKYDLTSQIRRSCKAAPALVAEGFAKRYMKRSWRKYLDDTIGECNETIHHLAVCNDVYSENVNEDLCDKLIKLYDITNKQLFRLKQSWVNFHHKD